MRFWGVSVGATAAVFLFLSAFGVNAEVQYRAELERVELSPDWSRLSYIQQLDLAAGMHDLELWVPGRANFIDPVDVDGAVLAQFEQSAFPAPLPHSLYTTAEQAAMEEVEAARTQLQRVEDEIAALQADMSAQELAIEAINQRMEIAADDAEAVRNIGAALAASLATLGRDRIDAQAALRDLNAELEQRQRALSIAEAAQYRQGQLETGLIVRTQLAVTQPGPVTLRFQTYTDRANWEPTYHMALDTESQILTLDLKAVLTNNTDAAWHDVPMVLLSHPLGRPLTPGNVALRPAQLRPQNDPSGEERTSVLRSNAQADFQSLDSGVATEAPIIEPATPASASPLGQAEQRFLIDRAVFVPADEREVTVNLNSREIEVTPFLRAAPRQNAHAFRMARFTNDGGPILPGEALVEVNGEMIGGRELPFIAAGQNQVLGFGEDRRIALEWHRREISEGERGAFTRESGRQENIEYVVENLSDELLDVEVLIAIPYTEQEALDIDVQLDPRPLTDRFENRRGLGQWELSVSPGAREVITMEAGFRWPEGQQMIWLP